MMTLTISEHLPKDHAARFAAIQEVGFGKPIAEFDNDKNIGTIRIITDTGLEIIVDKIKRQFVITAYFITSTKMRKICGHNKTAIKRAARNEKAGYCQL